MKDVEAISLFLQPLAEWSERSIRSCSSAMPGAFVLEKTHPLYEVKKLLALLVTFGSNNLLR